MKEVEPAGQPGKPFPACPRGQVSVCPELQTGTWLPQNPGHTIQLRPVPTSRPIDRPTGKHSEGGGREMRAWETKSCPTTGTLHGHASGPGAPFPATPGSRGPAGYRPPSPDPSGLGKKNVSTEAPPTNGPREGRRRGPSHPFRSTPHVLCRSRPREYDSARAGGSHQSGGRRGGAHAGMTTGKQACRPPSLSRPPMPSQRTARAAPHFGDERLEGPQAGVIHAPKGDPGQGQATRAQAVPGAAHPLPSLGRRPGPGLVGPRGRSGKSGCWSTRPGGPRACLGSAVTVTPSQACRPNLR